MQSCNEDSAPTGVKAPSAAHGLDQDAVAATKDSPEEHQHGQYYDRPRAASAAVTATFPGCRRDLSPPGPESSRGRLVASWLSWKRAWDLKRAAEGSAATQDPAHKAKVSSGKKTPAKRHREKHHYSLSAGAVPAGMSLDASGVDEDNRSIDDEVIRTVVDEERVAASRAVQPRKVVSLLLRRKSTRPPAPSSEQDEPDSSPKDSSKIARGQESAGRPSPKQRGFRRVRSQLQPPVSDASGGEGRRYLEYAAELDDDSFERLVEFTKHIALDRETLSVSGRGDRSDGIASTSPVASEAAGDEIIGEIRLEDYAEISDDEDLVDFLEDAESGDLGTSDASNRASSRALRTDNQKLRWVGNESEFAAFFADFGFDVPLDNGGSEFHAVDFDVGPDIFEEWAKFTSAHNEICRAWAESSSRGSSTLDIRSLARE